MALAFMPFWLAALIACVGSVASAQALSDDGDLKTFAVHINRTPPQSWPGYGVYLGNGFVLTAAHVPGNFAETKPHVLIAGQDLPASLIKEGSLGTIDLTLMAIDATNLPIRLRMSRMPLCEKAPFPGETVVVAIPGRDGTIPHSAARGNSSGFAGQIRYGYRRRRHDRKFRLGRVRRVEAMLARNHQPQNYRC